MCKVRKRHEPLVHAVAIFLFPPAWFALYALLFPRRSAVRNAKLTS